MCYVPQHVIFSLFNRFLEKDLSSYSFPSSYYPPVCAKCHDKIFTLKAQEDGYVECQLIVIIR